MVLAMAALLTYLKPTVSLEARDQFMNFRRHGNDIVPCAAVGDLLGSLLAVGTTLPLPKGALPVWPEVLGPLTRNSDLIDAFVRHEQLRI